jgi:hypothetical protein
MLSNNKNLGNYFYITDTKDDCIISDVIKTDEMGLYNDIYNGSDLSCYIATLLEYRKCWSLAQNPYADEKIQLSWTNSDEIESNEFKGKVWDTLNEEEQKKLKELFDEKLKSLNKSNIRDYLSFNEYFRDKSEISNTSDFIGNKIKLFELLPNVFPKESFIVNTNKEDYKSIVKTKLQEIPLWIIYASKNSKHLKSDTEILDNIDSLNTIGGILLFTPYIDSFNIRLRKDMIPESLKLRDYQKEDTDKRRKPISPFGDEKVGLYNAHIPIDKDAKDGDVKVNINGKTYYRHKVENPGNSPRFNIDKYDYDHDGGRKNTMKVCFIISTQDNSLSCHVLRNVVIEMSPKIHKRSIRDDDNISLLPENGWYYFKKLEPGEEMKKFQEAKKKKIVTAFGSTNVPPTPTTPRVKRSPAGTFDLGDDDEEAKENQIVEFSSPSKHQITKHNNVQKEKLNGFNFDPINAKRAYILDYTWIVDWIDGRDLIGRWDRIKPNIEKLICFITEALLEKKYFQKNDFQCFELECLADKEHNICVLDINLNPSFGYGDWWKDFDPNNEHVMDKWRTIESIIRNFIDPKIPKEKIIRRPFNDEILDYWIPIKNFYYKFPIKKINEPIKELIEKIMATPSPTKPKEDVKIDDLNKIIDDLQNKLKQEESDRQQYFEIFSQYPGAYEYWVMRILGPPRGQYLRFPYMRTDIRPKTLKDYFTPEVWANIEAIPSDGTKAGEKDCYFKTNGDACICTFTIEQLQRIIRMITGLSVPQTVSNKAQMCQIINILEKITDDNQLIIERFPARYFMPLYRKSDFLRYNNRFFPIPRGGDEALDWYTYQQELEKYYGQYWYNLSNIYSYTLPPQFYSFKPSTTSYVNWLAYYNPKRGTPYYKSLEYPMYSSMPMAGRIQAYRPIGTMYPDWYPYNVEESKELGYLDSGFYPRFPVYGYGNNSGPMEEFKFLNPKSSKPTGVKR